jgi:hypothetical protein
MHVGLLLLFGGIFGILVWEAGKSLWWHIVHNETDSYLKHLEEVIESKKRGEAAQSVQDFLESLDDPLAPSAKRPNIALTPLTKEEFKQKFENLTRAYRDEKISEAEYRIKRKELLARI